MFKFFPIHSSSRLSSLSLLIQRAKEPLKPVPVDRNTPFANKILLSQPRAMRDNGVSTRFDRLQKISEHGVAAGHQETGFLSQASQSALLSLFEAVGESPTVEGYHDQAKQFTFKVFFSIDHGGNTSKVYFYQPKQINGTSTWVPHHNPHFSSASTDALVQDIAENLPKGRYSTEVLLSSDAHNLKIPPNLEGEPAVRIEKAPLYFHQDKFAGRPLDSGHFDYLGFSILEQNTAPTDMLMLATGHVDSNTKKGAYRSVGDVSAEVHVPARKGAWYLINQNHKNAQGECVLHGNSGLVALAPIQHQPIKHYQPIKYNQPIKHHQQPNTRQLDDSTSGPCTKSWVDYVESVNQRSSALAFPEHAKRTVVVFRINDIPETTISPPSLDEMRLDDASHARITSFYEAANIYNELSKQENRVSIHYDRENKQLVVFAGASDGVASDGVASDSKKSGSENIKKFQAFIHQGERGVTQRVDLFTSRFVGKIQVQHNKLVLDQGLFEKELAAYLNV